MELGRQEANRQNAKTGRRAKKRLKTLPSALNVIVEVQTDTRKPPPPPDGLLDEKGHTLLRTRAQCSPGWPGTRESLSAQILLLTGKAGQHVPLQLRPHLFYFLIYLLFSQAFSFQRQGQGSFPLGLSKPHAWGFCSLCVRSEKQVGCPPLRLPTLST